jgi:raffinose/stachyose/melibiose transport system substrate-binding protein
MSAKNSKKISRRDLIKAAGFAAGAVALAACAPAAAPAPTAAPAATAAPQATQAAPTSAPAAPNKQFKILHWAQGAEPTDPNAQLATGQSKHVAYQTVADDYKKIKPNVSIEWYRFPAGAQFYEWLAARMTAQDSPDIYWANTEDIWPHVSQGWALDFSEYMNQPNPYVPDAKSWKDQFQDVAVYSQTGPDGKLYGVDMDGAGVLTVYNKAAFQKAGIDKEPKTWGEFMAAWKKLKDAGYIPFGGDLDNTNCCYAHWLEAHMYNQLIWDEVWKWDDDKNKVITSKEFAIHQQKGDFPDWDAYLKFAHMFKDMTQFLPTGFQGHVDYRQLFRQGKVAMYMEGNWAISDFTSSPPPFDISWLAFPIITKDIWPNAPEKVVRIQGAWGSMQYHVPGYLAQKEPDKVAAIMDWLMYSSKPDNVTRVLKETSMVPLTKGAVGRPELAPFNQPYDRAVPYQSWATLTGDAFIAEEKLWQSYLPNSMTDQQFLDAAKKALNAEVKKVLEANPDWKVK